MATIAPTLAIGGKRYLRSCSWWRLSYLTFIHFQYTLSEHSTRAVQAGPGSKLSVLRKSTSNEAGEADFESWCVLAGEAKFCAFNWQLKKRGEWKGQKMMERKWWQYTSGLRLVYAMREEYIEEYERFLKRQMLSSVSLQPVCNISVHVSAEQICHKWLTSGRTNHLTSPAEQTQSGSN